MNYKYWLTYFLIIALFYGVLWMIALASWREPENVHAMHYILEQDLLFIMFSLLPVLTILPINDRNMIFMIHVSAIFVHSWMGVYILLFEQDTIDHKYYIGVIILTSVGYLFVLLLGLTIYYGGFGSNFTLLFDEELEVIDFLRSQRTHNVMDSNFNDAFNKIHTVIYEPYLILKNKTCPICLVEYNKKDVIKILPNWYHTFHMACIESWFRTNLNWPFWRQVITREEIDKMERHNDSSIIRKIIASREASREGTFRGASLGKKDGARKAFDPNEGVT